MQMKTEHNPGNERGPQRASMDAKSDGKQNSTRRSRATDSTFDHAGYIYATTSNHHPTLDKMRVEMEIDTPYLTSNRSNREKNALLRTK